MASPYIDKLGTGSVLEKRKYHAKVLSESAIWTNVRRALDTLDLFSEWAWSESLFFIWLDISNLFIFGLDPRELEPLDPEFRVRLPSLREFLQGVKLKLEPIDLGEAWRTFYWDVYGTEVPPLLDFVTFVMAQCWPEYLGWLLEQTKRKLVVGESVYGTSYVDPPVVREFLRSSLFELVRRRVDLARVRRVFQVVVDGGWVSEGLAEAVYNRIAMHLSALFDAFVLDYNLLNHSRLCEPASDAAKVGLVTWRGEVVDARVRKFDEVNMGFVLDVTPLNLGILMDDRSVYRPSPLERRDVGTSVLSDFIDWKVRRMVSRYPATGVALGNYQRPEEALAFHESERADHHHQLRAFYYYVDAVVDRLLEGEAVDAFTKNMYRRAAAMLLGHRKKRHRWGYGAYEAMSEDEFRDYWLRYWSGQGLNPEVLNRIYGVLGKWARRYRVELRELGERLRRRRLTLSRALA